MPSTIGVSKQHPVPQNVLDVEFKLIGELTIKQFGYIAVGVILSFLIYKSGLYFIWRWFLIFCLVGLSVGMAFVPIQDRGLDIWVKSFVKALFSPAIMLWGKDPQTPRFLLTIEDFLTKAPPLHEDTSRLEKKVELTDILGRLEDTDADPLEKKRREFIEGLDFSFGEPTPQMQGSKPAPPASPSPPKQAKSYLQYEMVNKKAARKEAVQGTVPKEIEPKKVEPKRGTRVAKESFVRVKKAPVAARKPPQREEKRHSIFSTMPNIVHGVVFDKEGKLLEGAVVMIKDQDGDPVRALKSNSLGRFVITTPLDSGNYIIDIRKEGQRFDTIKLSLTGKKLESLTVRAR